MIEKYTTNGTATFSCLAEFLPDYLTLLKPTAKELDLISKRFDKRYLTLEKALENKGVFKTAECLIDVIWKAQKNNKESIALIKFINQQCKTIRTRVERQIAAKLKHSLKNLIINFDAIESRFEDYIGEICILAKLLENSDVRLISVETPLNNGKSVDYEVYYSDTRFLVEVLNVHFDANKIRTRNDLEKFFSGREERKINNKLKDAELESGLCVTFTEIIWGNLVKLSPYIDFFKERNIYNGLLAPLMYVGQLTNPNNGDITYGFLTAAGYLEKYKKYSESCI